MPLISFDTPQRFSDIFRGYQKRSLAWNWLRITLCSSIRIDRPLVTLFTSIRILIDSLPAKCKCNMGIRPIKKFFLNRFTMAIFFLLLENWFHLFATPKLKLLMLWESNFEKTIVQPDQRLCFWKFHGLY